MSFKRFEADDLVVSAEPVSSPVWSTGEPTLTAFYTSSAQANGVTGNYYINVYQTGSTENGAAVQFAVAYADVQGSGSLAYNSAIPGTTYSRTTYGQLRNLVLGDEETTVSFNDYSPNGFYVVSIDRDRYKESLLQGSFNLTLTNGANTLHLTDNSGDVNTVTFNDAGRVFQVVSGSNGSAYSGTGYTTSSGSYGLFLPDVGVVLLNADALDDNSGEGINLGTGRNSNTDDDNEAKLFNSIVDGSSFQLNYQETISSQFVFTRVRNSEFNYSTNPSYITGSGDLRINNFVNAPQTYITTVGMYNDNNELLAVAKLSKPLLKDFTKEALIRIKLDF